MAKTYKLGLCDNRLDVKVVGNIYQNKDLLEKF